MATRFKLKPAVYLVLVHDDKVLLLRRKNTGWNDGNYSLVAGHADGDESMRRAMIREAQEEAGIMIKPEDLELLHVMHRRSDVPNSAEDEYVDFYFTPTRYEGEPRNMEPEKCDDLSWFSFDDLPSNMVDSVRQALGAIKDGLHYSEYGWDAA